MSRRRFFKRQISLRCDAKGFAFFLVILLLSGCADESINNPIAEKPVEDSNTDDIVPISFNYLPMTAGSRWVYRSPDGSEWSREVTKTEEIGSRSYHDFNYNPPIEDNQFAYYRAHKYIATPDSLFLKVKPRDINDAVWKIIRESNDNSPGWVWIQKFQNGVWKTRKKGLTYLNAYKASGVLRSESGYLFRLPLVPGQTWEMLNIRFSGIARMGFMQHSFEADAEILGKVADRHSIATPAGIFEDCLNIRYEVKPPSVKTIVYANWAEVPDLEKKKLRKHLEAELRNELTTLLTRLIPILGLESVWLAPGVGPVRIEGAEGRAVLIDYEIKAVASDQWPVRIRSFIDRL